MSRTPVFGSWEGEKRGRVSRELNNSALGSRPGFGLDWFCPRGNNSLHTSFVGSKTRTSNDRAIASLQDHTTSPVGPYPNKDSRLERLCRITSVLKFRTPLQ